MRGTLGSWISAQRALLLSAIPAVVAAVLIASPQVHAYPNHCPNGIATSIPAGVDPRNPGNCNWDFTYSDGSRNVMGYGPGGLHYGRVCPGEKLPDPAHVRTYIPGQCAGKS